MKRTTAPVTLTLLVLFLAAAGEVRAHQPHDPLRSLAASPDFSDDGTLLVATLPTTQVPGSRFLLKTEDGGASWRTVHRGLPNVGVPEIAFSPDFARDGLVLVGTCGAGLFRSDDRGEHWRNVDALDAGDSCLGRILFSEAFARNRTVYLRTGDGRLLRSLDGAESWQPLVLPGGAAALDLQVHSGVPGEPLLVGTGKGLLLSEDGGLDWRLSTFPTGEAAVGHVAAAPGREGLLVAVGERFLWRSGDGGGSWKAIAALERNARNGDQEDSSARSAEEGSGSELVSVRAPVTGLTFLPAEGDPLLVVSTAGEIWTAEGTGERWIRSMEGLRKQGPGGRLHYAGLVALPPRTLLVAGWEGIHRSDDAGRSWRHQELIRPYATRGVLFSPGYREDRTIFAATYGSGVLVSRDGGRSWTAENLGLANTHLDPVVSSAVTEGGGTLFVGNVRGVWRRDGEGPWREKRPAHRGERDECRVARYGGRWDLRNYVRALELSPGFPEPAWVLAGGESGCIDRSEDGGETWRMAHDAGDPVTVIRHLRGKPGKGIVLAGLSRGGMLASRDSGRTWGRVEGFPSKLTVSDIEAAPGSGSEAAIYASTFEEGVFVSRDGGTSWSATGGPAVSVLALEVSPGLDRDGWMLAATNGRGVLRSTDRGRTWSPTELPVAVAVDLALSPAFLEDGEVVCGTPLGPYLSRDRGRSWRPALDRARYEERSNQIRWSEGWSLTRPPGASGAAVMKTGEEGAELEFVFHGSAVSWIGGRGPGYSTAEIWVDGEPEASVDLQGAEEEDSVELCRTRSRRVGAHTLRIRVGDAAVPGAVRATVDAFDVWLDPGETDPVSPDEGEGRLLPAGGDATPTERMEECES